MSDGMTEAARDQGDGEGDKLDPAKWEEHARRALALQPGATEYSIPRVYLERALADVANLREAASIVGVGGEEWSGR